MSVENSQGLWVVLAGDGAVLRFSSLFPSRISVAITLQRTVTRLQQEARWGWCLPQQLRKPVDSEHPPPPFPAAKLLLASRLPSVKWERIYPWVTDAAIISGH